MLFPKPFHLSSIAATASAQSPHKEPSVPYTQAMSVRNGHVNCVPHLWTVGCTSTAERTQVVVSIAFSLLFLFPPFLVENKETEALFMSLLNLLCISVCLSVSFSPWRGPTPTTVPPCCHSKSSIYIHSPSHLPPRVHRPTVHRMLHLQGIIHIR